jgi:mitochondrial intermembrane space import and assembly protein 40
MQDCFRQYPEVYGEELDEEEEEGKKRNGSGEIHGIEDADPSPNSSSSPTPSDSSSRVGTPEKIADTRPLPSSPVSEQEVAGKQSRAKAARQAMKPVEPESEGALIPKASHDAKQNVDGK